MHAPHKACNFRFIESKGRGEKQSKAESKGRDMQRAKGNGRDMQRGKGRGGLMAECYFRVIKQYIYTCFFLSDGWLNRFGLVQFNRFQTLETETEPNQKFYVIFNRLIRFFFRLFFFGFLGLIDFFAHPYHRDLKNMFLVK